MTDELTTNAFLKKAKEIIQECYGAGDDIQIVWFGYVLGSMKTVLIDLGPNDFMYEITYDRDRNQIYADRYCKTTNKAIPIFLTKGEK